MLLIEKIILFVILVLLNFNVFSQSGFGVINVSAFSNDDNKIKNNIEITSLELLIIDAKTNDTISNGIAELSKKFNVKPGDYFLIANTPDYSRIETNVNVSIDRITFIDLLFEPKKRKRKGFVTGLD
jgi:hypothetical protein